MIQTALNNLGHERRTVLLQLVRYGLAGLAITLAAAGSYWAITDLAHVDPMVSYGIVFLVYWNSIWYLLHFWLAGSLQDFLLLSQTTMSSYRLSSQVENA